MLDPHTGDNVLFISHTAADRAYAVALETAIDALLGADTAIDVRYSTSDEAGPQGGDRWREWIYSQVVEARTALIVVTPHALGKPWLLWEAGACRGAALAMKAAGQPPPGGALGTRLIISIAYGLTENECPDPLRGDQIVRGADDESMRTLFKRILEAHGVDGTHLFKAGERMEKVLARYVGEVQRALLQTPSLVTESNIQDWLSRLDELVRSQRLSELTSFARWMTLAFGRDGDAASVPIDVRLHRRLGELYLKQNEHTLAAEQLMLARRAAPRDIYVLRPLAEVSMKRRLAEPATEPAGPYDEIESLLTAMKELDDKAFVSTPDAAALRGKYLRRVRRDPEQAIETYRAALTASPDSYYLADVLAQTELDLGRMEDARVSFRRALEIVERLGENSLWSHATAATACLALDDPDGARRHLSAVAALGPLSKSDGDAIRGGFLEVARRFGVASAVCDQLLLALVNHQTGPIA
jgi:tetratricopeptide (TPR) repeat protein